MLKKLIALLLIAISLPVFAQVDRSKMPEPGPAPEIQLGDVESFTLDNGLKVFVVENDKLPTVAVSLEIKRDAIMEGDIAGYINIAGDLMRTGTANRTKSQIDEEVDFIGASLNTSSTGVFGFTLKKHVEKFFDVMADVVKNAKFTQEELDKLKKQTISGLAAGKEDPNQIAGNVRRALVYGLDHPYGEQITEGTVESVTLEDCQKYYETYFRPNVGYIAIVGDVSVSEAEDLVEEYFGDWKAAEVPSHEFTTPKAPIVNKVALVDRAAAVQSVIHVTYPVDLQKNSEDVIKASVMNSIIGGSFSSRFNQNLREDKGFTYGARSSLSTDELIASFDASCEARNSVTDSAVTEFLYEMEKMVTEPVSQDELDATIAYLMGSFSRSLERPQTIARFAINIDKYDLPKDYYKNYLKNLEAVTVEDVQAMAKKYIKPDKAYILVIGNGDEVADNLKKFSLSGKIKYYDIYGSEVDPAAMAIPEGLTAAAVIDKYAEAIGGKEKIFAINDFTQKMTGSMGGNMQIEASRYYKAPNKEKSEVLVMGMTQLDVFDGEKGRKEGMGQSSVYEGDELAEKKVTSDAFFMFKPEKYNFTAELTGMESVEGKDAYRIAFTLPGGKVTTYYFDVESGLAVKNSSTVETPQGSFTQSSMITDYKEVSGVKFPHTITIQMGPQAIKMETKSLEVNTGLEDSLFN